MKNIKRIAKSGELIASFDYLFYMLYNFNLISKKADFDAWEKSKKLVRNIATAKNVVVTMGAADKQL
jgi:hypothetical protein